MNWVPILMYHEIERGRVCRKYGVTAADFGAQIDYLMRADRTGSMGRQNVVLTFDDGHKSFAKIGWPKLRGTGFTPLLFVTTDYIDKRRDHLDWKDLEQLRNEGASIQSHGVTHRFLWSLQDDDLRQELAVSKRKIEDHLGVSVRYLSCPGGRYSKRILRMAKEEGYEKVFVSNTFPAKSDRDLGAVGRILIHSGLDIGSFTNIVKGNLVWRTKQKALSHVKRVLLCCLGDSVYYRLWRIRSNRKSGGIG